MAYGKRAYSDFYDHRWGVHWTIEIWEKDYSDSYTIMKLGGDPVSIRKVSNESLFKIIQGSELTLTIIHEPGDDYSYLFTNNARKFLIKFWRSGVLYWTGYVLPGQSMAGFEPYRKITITATDGLGGLKEALFATTNVDSDFEPYEDFQKIIIILGVCLAKTDLSLNINCMMNLLPEEYNDPALDSSDALALVYARQRRFMNALFNPTSCYTVVEELLRPLVGCKIMQCYGEWWIIRTPEQFGNNIKYRTFDSTGSYVSNSTKDILRIMTGPDGDPLVVPVRGAGIENKLGNKSIQITNDFGLRPSLFSGYNFPPNEFDIDTPTDITLMKHFSVTSLSEWAVRKVGERYTIACIDYDVFNPDNYFYTNPISVRAGDGASPPAVAETMKLIIKGGTLHLFPQSVLMQIIVYTESTYYEYWPPSAVWLNVGATEPTYLTAFNTTLPHADTYEDAKDIQILIEDPIPADGFLTIRFYNADHWPFINEILLTIQMNGNDWTWGSQVYNYEIDSDDTVIPEPVVMLFSDNGTSPKNVHLFSDGIFCLYPEDVLFSTGLWAVRDDSNLSPLSSWNGQMYVDQNKLALFRGTIIAEEFHFYDALKIPEYDNRIFVPDDVVLNIKAGTITGTFIEVKDSTLSFSLTRIDNNPIPLTQIQTGGGDIIYSGSGGGGGGSTPFTNYRTNSEALVAASGGDLIAFSSPFLPGTTYDLFIKVVSSEGYLIGGVVSLEDEDGFTIDVDEAATLTYFAIKRL